MYGASSEGSHAPSTCARDTPRPLANFDIASVAPSKSSVGLSSGVSRPVPRAFPELILPRTCCHRVASSDSATITSLAFSRTCSLALSDTRKPLILQVRGDSTPHTKGCNPLVLSLVTADTAFAALLRMDNKTSQAKSDTQCVPTSLISLPSVH